jgi:uncharacterized protein YjbI with pentapeptide repeats
MKIFKPNSLALLYRSFRFAQRNSLAVGMMACFHIDRSTLTDLLPETEMWAAVAQALGPEAILDEGMPKRVGEFKLYGAAHSPHGAAVSEQAVSVRVGALAKTLVVSGDRQFNAAGLISATQTYTRMPITPQTAFGGTGFADNPPGRGFAKIDRADGSSHWPLPNVEMPHRRIANRGDQADPAGFWGFDATSPQRQKHLGQFDERWLKRGWPHLPDDTRPEFFLTSPLDQRLSGYFSGNETLEMHNLHPQRAVIEARLPGLRARCFINRRSADGGERFDELATNAETVWLFPEQECGIVLYRALASVADEDAEDILHVMAEWESLDTAALPFEHYQTLLHSQIRSQLPTPASVAAAASSKISSFSGAPMSVPAVPTAVLAAGAQNAPGAAFSMSPEMIEAQAMAEELNQNSMALIEKHGLKEQDLARFMTPEPPQPVASFAEVEKMAQDLNAQTRELMQQHEITDQDLEPFLKPAPEGPPASMAELKAMVEDVERQTQEQMKKAGINEDDVYRILESRPELEESAANLRASRATSGPFPTEFPASPVSRLPAIEVGAVAAATTVLAGLPTAAATPQRKLTREDVIARHAGKESLAGYDLSGLDLTALDLSTADFSGALLEKALFAKSTLSGANFTQALLQGADFSGSDLTQAKLIEVSAGACKFADADLRGADLSQADFSGADFSAARLSGAKLSDSLFDGASMAAVNASACQAAQASFSDCDLTEANFGQANLQQARFNGSQLAASNFSGARCDQAEFYGVQAQKAVFTDASLRASRADAASRFEQAVFLRAQIVACNWDGANLQGATLESATLDDTDFSHVQAAGAVFRRASAKGAKFSKADLSGADLDAINLFKGSLRKTKIDGTLMRGANLYGVDFEGTQPTMAALERSNIDQTILQFRPPVI